MSEEDYQMVMVALNDGLFGNKVLANINGLLTTGVFNYIRNANSRAYTLQDVLGIFHKYIYQPLTEEQIIELCKKLIIDKTFLFSTDSSFISISLASSAFSPATSLTG